MRLSESFRISMRIERRIRDLGLLAELLSECRDQDNSECEEIKE